MSDQNIQKLVKWDSAAREHYTYEYDKIQYKKAEDWRSHADEVLAGKKWKDDCDGLAMTVIDLLCRDNYDPELLYRAMVDSTGGKNIDHFIGIASDGSRWFVVGDTFGPAYPIAQMKHKLLAVSKVADGIKWVPVDHTKWVR
jgi:hypothetical protein